MSLTEKQKESQQKHYNKKKSEGKTRTDEVRAREREYYRKRMVTHAEQIREQRRVYQAVWSENNKDKIREYHQAYRHENLKVAFDAAKKRAKEKGLPFNITRDYIRSITPSHCPILGIVLKAGKEELDSSFSIDRIIPELGYVVGNVQIISTRANRLRSDASPEELRKIADFIERVLSINP